MLTSDEIAESVDLLGEVQFLAIDDTGAGWIARLKLAEPFVIATDDPTAASSWSLVEVGTSEGESDFDVLNNQELVRAGSGGDWLYIYSGVMWHADQAPSSSTAWTGRWAPNRIPTFPANYDELKDGDPTLCDADPVVAISPDMGQLGFASADLGFLIYPAGGVNQLSTDPPGVCVSHDGGGTFHQVPFEGLGEDVVGPFAVHCVDPDRCWAFGGLNFDDAPAYVYYSLDASADAPTWDSAQVPSEVDADHPRALAMAPDGRNGWLVGDRGLVWRTADGGATWTDAGAALTAVAADVDWTTVFALDADHVWLGGDDGILAARE